MNSNLLVKYEGNWADEIEIEGIAIIDSIEWENLVDKVKKYFEKGYFLTNYVGTNEEIEYQYFQNWLDCYSIEPITEQEAEIINRLILNNNCSAGKFFYPEDLELD